MPSQAKQLRVQLANIQPGLTAHWNEIDSHAAVSYLFSHTRRTAYTVYTPKAGSQAVRTVPGQLSHHPFGVDK